MKKTLSFTFLALLLGAMLPNSLSAQSTPKEHTEKFFSIFDKQGVDAAIDTLYSTNKWMTKNQKAVDNLKEQMTQELNSESIGNYFGQDLVIDKQLTDNYRVLRYIVKFERQPIKFTFQYYRPNKEWKIYSFRYSFRVAEEIEEATTLELLDIEEE